MVEERTNSSVLLLSPSNDSDISGLDVFFVVDPLHLTSDELEEYDKYLKSRKLFIDVFDGDNHIKYGTVCISLKDLSRIDAQSSVHYTREFNIIETLENTSHSDSGYEPNSTSHKGKLYMRLTNVGRRASGAENVLHMKRSTYESRTLLKRVTHVQSLQNSSTDPTSDMSIFDKRSMEERLRKMDMLREVSRVQCEFLHFV